MPQSDAELPEGTDQIIDGAAGSSETSNAGDSGGSAFAGFKGQVRDTTQSLRQQAGDRVRNYAVDGKDRATSALDSVAQVLAEAAASVDEKLGGEYGQYAHRAADTVRTFTDSIRDKDVDELYDDARELVRKSPAVAVGLAAAIGFALIRVVKAGAAPDDDADAGRSQRKGGSNRRSTGA